jgi:hypothetical protein
MDKHILHSVLESVTAGSNITINFHEPFAELSGDYTVLVSKTGRGRGGSRVLEVASVASPEDTFGALEIDGKEKLLGTGTSEVIATLVIDGKTFGLEDPIETARKPNVRRARTAGETDYSTSKQRETTKRARVSSNVAQGARVANAMGQILTDNPVTTFRIVGKDRNAAFNGQWKVESFNYVTDCLTMNLVGLEDSSQTFAFDSSVHGADVRDVQVIGIEDA